MVRSVRIVAAIETVSRVLGAIGSLYLDFTAFQGLQEYSGGQFCFLTFLGVDFGIQGVLIFDENQIFMIFLVS